METDKMSTASSVGYAERRTLMQALVIERRTLFGCTVIIGLSTFVWIAAVCTEQWVHIDGGEGVYMPKANLYFYYSTSGLWQTCRHVGPPLTIPPPTSARPSFVNTTAATNNVTISGHFLIKPGKPDLSKAVTNCTNFLSQELENGTNKDPAYNVDVANYSRTMVSFAIISLFVMAMGCGFSAYTFINPRYMFKRLASGIHFISTACTMVPTQIMTSNVDFFKKNMKVVYPDHARHYYGVSIYLAWYVVLVNLASGLVFLWYSRKRKGNKAATDELAMADEPTIIGR